MKLLIIMLPLLLSGCAGFFGAAMFFATKVVPPIAGAMTVAKDGLDLDVSLHHLKAQQQTMPSSPPVP